MTKENQGDEKTPAEESENVSVDSATENPVDVAEGGKVKKSFEELSNESQIGLIQEFVDFLKYNKKWWLTPIIVVLLMVGALIFLTTSGAAPFLYSFW